MDHHKPPFPFVALDQPIAAEVDHFLTGANKIVDVTRRRPPLSGITDEGRM